MAREQTGLSLGTSRLTKSAKHLYSSEIASLTFRDDYIQLMERVNAIWTTGVSVTI